MIDYMTAYNEIGRTIPKWDKARKKQDRVADSIGTDYIGRPFNDNEIDSITGLEHRGDSIQDKYGRTSDEYFDFSNRLYQSRDNPIDNFQTYREDREFANGGYIGMPRQGLAVGLRDGSKIRQGALLAKGGQVGNGIQVKGRPGKDTIKTTVKGTPVRLDNNEIVDGDVVISDDLGEADVYRRMIANGMNPDEVSAIMKQRAVQLNPNPQGDGRAYGGYNQGIWPPSGIPNDNNIIPGYNYRYDPSVISGQSQPTNIKLSPQYPTGKARGVDRTSIPQPLYNYANTVAATNLVNSSMGLPTYQAGLNNYKQFDATNLASPSGNYNGATSGIGDKPSFGSRVGQNIQNNPTGVAEGLGFAAQTLGNINAAIQLGKIRPRARVNSAYNNLNPDANKAVYNSQVSDINRMGRNYEKQVLGNTSNSNVALARLNALEGNQVNQIGRVRSQQAADRSRINNANTIGQNRNNQFNTAGTNRHNEYVYNDQVSRINTNNALVGSTVTSLNNIIANVRKGDYQSAQLYAIAQQYDLDISGEITQEKLLAALYASRGQQMQTIIGKK